MAVTLEQVLGKIDEWEAAGAIGGDLAVEARMGAQEAADEGPLDGALNAISSLVDEANGLSDALIELQEKKT